MNQTDALGNKTSFTYDANGNQLTQTTTITTPSGPRTLATSTAYDSNGHPTAVTDAEGNATRFEYDSIGKRTVIVDAAGSRTEFKYDERGQPLQTVFADGTSTSSTFDAAGHWITSIDRAGRTTSYHYDAVGRLTATLYPDGTQSSTEYDLAGRVTARIDENGNRTEFVYNPSCCQATTVRDSLGHETHSTFDATNRKISETDALGRTTQFIYDSVGRRTATVFADGTRKITTYDSVGHVVAETDQAGVIMHVEYDGLGRLTAVVDALGGRTEYTYNEAGNLTSQKDAKGRITRYEYDGLGRRIATVLPLGQRSTTTYEPLGNVASTTDFNGQTIRFQYDVNRRLARKQFPDSSSVVFTYTPTGRRQMITDSRGVITFAYDSRDRLLSRTDPDGRTIEYSYDSAGNRTSVRTPSGTTLYGFDALNRLNQVTDSSGGLATFTYDEVNNQRTATLPNGTTRIDTYDQLNRLTLREHRNATGIFASYQYTLDPTGNRTKVVEESGRTVEYSYDQLYRLTRETITDPPLRPRIIIYTMDAVGNCLNRNDSLEGATTFTYNNNDELLSEIRGTTTMYTYDANGNTLSKVTDTSNRASHTWDFQNRLVAANVTSAGVTKQLAYSYDDDGIRVASSVNGDETRYLVDANRPYAQVVEEYAPDGTVKAAYTPGPHHMISQMRAGLRSYYHADHLGSTRALTGPTGSSTDRYYFDAYGRTVRQTGSTQNSYLFAGEQRDANLSLDYLRARYLNFNAARFVNRDEFEHSVGNPVSGHKYQYGNGDPVNNVDPTGKDSLEVAVSIATLGILAGLPSPALAINLPGKLDVKGWPRRLNWRRDFWREAPSGFPYDAQTDCGFREDPPPSWQGSPYRFTVVHIKIELGPGTFRKPGRESPSLLSHEQGHYDICGIVGRDYGRSLLKLREFSQDVLLMKRQQLFDEASERLKWLHSDPDNRYDTQTRHGLSPEPQAAWKNAIELAAETDLPLEEFLAVPPPIRLPFF